ncbi:HD domain-containing protein [Ileibacterium valens]|uniref:HD domain-containing protein n=1 Tax=Ileibacterium valens TaxID=1862668 RepID=UPI00259B5AB7|nr:HD domain-containing protein [Ileibacterium valens]
MSRQSIKKSNRRYHRAQRIKKIRKHLEDDGRFLQLKNFNHHGATSVHTHVVNVAWWAHRLADLLPAKTDRESLVRGALLHDYFLYDWHDNHGHSPHGFTHPRTALNNAKDDFDLNEKESDIILSHMWPLTIRPPKYRESWLVTIADKIATFEETLGKRKSKKYRHPKTSGK